jgi:hypothetical protein
MLVSSLAVLVRRGRVGFRLVVLALRMLMRRLMMVMRGGLMSGSSVVMMIAGRMLGRLSHLIFLLWLQRASEVVFAYLTCRNSTLAAESGLFGREHTDLSHKLALARGHLFADSDDIHLGVLDLGK